MVLTYTIGARVREAASANVARMTRVLGRSLAVALVLVVGCSASPSSDACASNDDCRVGQICLDGHCRAGTDAGPLHDGGPRPDTNIDAATAPDTGNDASCGGAGIGVTGTPPAVLIVFDRSCSMRRRVDDATMFASGPEDPLSRWFVAREAVRTMIARFPSRVNWGLLTFPGVLQGCGEVPPVAVQPAPGVGDMVMANLMSSEVQPYTYCTPPSGSPPGMQPQQTPTSDALAAARAVPALSDPSRQRFVILITDGGASCGETESSLGTQTSSIRDEVAPVAVIGFSSEAETPTAGPLLEAIAANGGLPRPGAPPSYYHADTGAELEALLDALVSAALPCTFALSEAPPDPTMLRVATEDGPLAEDPVDGWTYDAASMSLVLHGAACDHIRDGTTTRIDAAYGCPVPACTPVPEACDGLDNDCNGLVDDDCLG
jgi:hypothetical protein